MLDDALSSVPLPKFLDLPLWGESDAILSTNYLRHVGGICCNSVFAYAILRIRANYCRPQMNYTADETRGLRIMLAKELSDFRILTHSSFRFSIHLTRRRAFMRNTMTSLHLMYSDCYTLCALQNFLTQIGPNPGVGRYSLWCKIMCIMSY